MIALHAAPLLARYFFVAFFAAFFTGFFTAFFTARLAVFFDTFFDTFFGAAFALALPFAAGADGGFLPSFNIPASHFHAAGPHSRSLRAAMWPSSG